MKLIFALAAILPFVSAASECPKKSMECVPTTSAQAFKHCSNGNWYSVNCPTGTVCRQNGDAVDCTFPDTPAPAPAPATRTVTTVTPTGTPTPSDCTSGAYRCNEKGAKQFQQCDNGVWKQLECAGPLVCSNENGVLCNYKSAANKDDVSSGAETTSASMFAIGMCAIGALLLN